MIGHRHSRLVSLLGCLCACASPSSLARLSVDVNVGGLSADQLALLDHVDIRCAPGTSADPSLVHLTSVPSAALTDHAYQESYAPAQEEGTIVVTASLWDKDGNQLGAKSQAVPLVKAKVAHVELDFVSSVPTTGPFHVGTPPVVIGDGKAGATSFALAWDTDHYLMVWSDAGIGNGDLVSARYDANGNRISNFSPVNSSDAPSVLPSLVRLGDGYVVAWQEGASNAGTPTTVQLRKLDLNGLGVGNIRRISTQSQEARPHLEAFGTELALTWMDADLSGGAPRSIARMAILDSSQYNFVQGPVDLASSPTATSAGFPIAAATDSGLTVSWIEGGTTVELANFDAMLQMSSPVALHSSSFTAQQLALAGHGSTVYAAWEELSGDIATGRERIFGSYGPSGGVAGAQGYVNELYTGSANWPRIATRAQGGVLVAYYQYRDFGSQIYMTRLTDTGERLDASDVQLTSVAGQAKYPEITKAQTDDQGEHFGLAWIDDHTGTPSLYFETLVDQ